MDILVAKRRLLGKSLANFNSRRNRHERTNGSKKKKISIMELPTSIQRGEYRGFVSNDEHNGAVAECLLSIEEGEITLATAPSYGVTYITHLDGIHLVFCDKVPEEPVYRVYVGDRCTSTQLTVVNREVDPPIDVPAWYLSHLKNLVNVNKVKILFYMGYSGGIIQTYTFLEQGTTLKEALLPQVYKSMITLK
jgi:hypothetical protein